MSAPGIMAMRTSTSWRRTLCLSLCCASAVLGSACGETAPAECNPFVDASCKQGVAEPGGNSGGVADGHSTGSSTQDDGPVLPGFDPTDAQGTVSEDFCEVEEIPARIQPANVMLVLDKSGSMSKNKWLDHDVERTRWESLYKTVEFMVGQFNQSVRFGMKLFPGKDAKDNVDTCKVAPGVEVPIADMNGQAIMAGMPGPQEPVLGGTPAVTGYTRAVEYLKSVAQAGDTRRRIIILVMDGRVADCDEQHGDLVTKAEEAKNAGIMTFVVGIDVDPSTQEGFQLDGDLRSLAKAGGTTNYFDSSNPQKLRTAMEEIVGRISDCRVPLTVQPQSPDWATVEVGGASFRWLGAAAKSCEAANLAPEQGGFIYVDMDGKKAMNLCGQACTNYINTGNVKVNILCEPPK